jgi:peptide/nickel transport system ATP-binding protein
MSDLLTIRDLAVSFETDAGPVDAVRGASLRVPRHGTVALVGESGSGKSVLAQSIMGILPVNAKIRSGQILFDDPATDGPPVDIAALPRDSRAMRAIRGGRISIIFQEPMTSLSPVHTIGNQIGEALNLHRDVSRQESGRLTAEMLRMVGFPDPERALRTYPFELSGGLRQRAMIAMALVCRPALLIADEPTTALDVTIQAHILKLMRDLQGELGMAVLLITHDLGVVANMADEVVVMYHGQIMEMGPARDLFENPKHPYLRALLKAVPRFDMKPGERLTPIREIEPGEIKMLADGKDHGANNATLLSVEGITKHYKLRQGAFSGRTREILAVDDISFDIKRGECLGLVGESGCGKTTLSKVIMRALTPDAGRIVFDDDGTPVDLLALEGSALKKYRQKISYIFQDPYGSLDPRMTIYDIVSEPMVIHEVGTREERMATVAELVKLVGLDMRHLKRYPHSFSGGQRQRIGIARALALRPEFMICDEPVSALDVSIQAQVLNLLKDLQNKLHLTVLFISHNLAVVDYMADRIAVMCAGRIVELAPKELLFRNPMHPYTRALLTAVPEPDINQPLDFARLAEDRASDPAAWPAPYTIDETHTAHLVDIGEGHLVRMSDQERQVCRKAS